jgi:hypothetical protein
MATISFIKDPNQYLNQLHPEQIPKLIQQIEIHTQFLMIQQQQQMIAQQQEALAQQKLASNPPSTDKKAGEYASERGTKA